jgi:HK97 family phage major capsid protein
LDLYLDSLVQKKNEATHRMHEVIVAAETEQRELSAEENANLTTWDADFEKYNSEIRRITDLKEKIGPAADRLAEATDRSRVETRKADSFSFNKFVGTPDDKSLRSFDTFRTIPVGAHVTDPAVRAIVEREMEARALQAGGGGSAVETSFANFVTVYERTLNPLMDISTVIPTTTGSPIVLPRLTADVASSGTVTAEGGGITEGDPTISQVTLNAWKRAFTTLWSSELDQDEIIGLDQLVANSIGRHIGLAWGTAFTLGNDSSEAHGYLTAIGTVAQLGTALGTAGSGVALDTFFSGVDLIDAFYALAGPYRSRASWVVATTAVAKMAKFRSSDGQFLYTNSQVVGRPDAFLGRPVYENPAMAAVASAAISVSVGDFSAYIIRDVQPLRVDRSTEYKFNTDQVALRVITRRDGDLPDVTAIRAFRCANT